MRASLQALEKSANIFAPTVGPSTRYNFCGARMPTSMVLNFGDLNVGHVETYR